MKYSVGPKSCELYLKKSTGGNYTGLSCIRSPYEFVVVYMRYLENVWDEAAGLVFCNLWIEA